MIDDNTQPYTELKTDGYILREFDSDIDVDELIWHRDTNDRIVEIVQGIGWKFQLDNKVPIDLAVGDTITIPKEIYHRIICGNSKLIIKIKEY